MFLATYYTKKQQPYFKPPFDSLEQELSYSQSAALAVVFSPSTGLPVYTQELSKELNA